MTETVDPRPLYERALTQTAELIAAVRPGQLSDATPCSEYDVRGLLSHLVGTVHKAARTGEAGKADIESWVDGVPDDGWPAAFAEAAERVRLAWADDATLDRPAEVPWGTVPGRGALAGYVQELTTHDWDLAIATGQSLDGLDPRLAEFALDMMHRVLPAEPRGGPVPFGPVQPAPDDADAYTRLAAWLGRRV